EKKQWALTDEAVHYLCEDTRQFDGGGSAVTIPDGGSNDAACPADSRVTYFTVDPRVISNDQLIGDDCQKNQTCNDKLTDWFNKGLARGPNWRCADKSASCSKDLYELR